MQHVSQLNTNRRAETSLNEYGRQPLEPFTVAMNAESLFPFNIYKHQATGYFADYDHARLTDDGYISAPCSACGREIFAVMAQDERGDYPEPIDDGVEVVRGDHMACAACAKVTA
jgi:hypothetical protein